MPSEYDPSDFVDNDFQAARKNPYAASTASSGADGNRPPTREEVDNKVTETQAKLAELRRAQEELERERAGLEELRRRQMEFQTGRDEMLQHLTRGVGLLEESEFAARREAEAMAKTLAELREAQSKVQLISEQSWSKEAYNVELTRALTTLENARMEWNSARLKFAVLSGSPPPTEKLESPPGGHPLFSAQSIGELCKLGLALTWPLVLLLLGIFLALVIRR